MTEFGSSLVYIDEEKKRRKKVGGVVAGVLIWRARLGLARLPRSHGLVHTPTHARGTGQLGRSSLLHIQSGQT